MEVEERQKPAPRPAAALRRDPNPGFFRGTLHAGYDLVWLLASVLGLPWLVYKSIRVPAFGRMVRERLGRGLASIPAPTRPRILVHGVSVGEVKGALPIVRALEEAYPDMEVVISTSTDTGLEVGRKLFPANLVVRFPADLSFVVWRFLRRIDPSLVLLFELEIWPNFLRICNRSARPVVVVNGRITEVSHGYYLIFRKLLPQFNRISLFCVQLERYAERFLALGVASDRILVTGNVKADGLPTGDVEPGEELSRLLGGRSDQPVVVAGSTHAPEERLVADAWRAAAPEARLVLVPRHPQRSGEVVSALAEAGFEVQLLSALRAGAEEPDPAQIAVVDTIGELERVYGLADVVFVGGSLIPHGGQNVLEPAAQGKAVVFGPHVMNFSQEVALLAAAGGCRQVADVNELKVALREILADGEARARMGEAARQAVEAQRGATRMTLEALDVLVLERMAAESQRTDLARTLSAG